LDSDLSFFEGVTVVAFGFGIGFVFVDVFNVVQVEFMTQRDTLLAIKTDVLIVWSFHLVVVFCVVWCCVAFLCFVLKVASFSVFCLA